MYIQLIVKIKIKMSHSMRLALLSSPLTLAESRSSKSRILHKTIIHIQVANTNW